MPKLLRSRLTSLRQELSEKTTLLKALLRSSRVTEEGALLPTKAHNKKALTCTTGSGQNIKKACRELREVLKKIETIGG